MNPSPNSSAAGYLRSDTAPLYDKDLEDIFQRVVVGVTGLPGQLVRPRYQPDPPTMPGFDVDWASLGVAVQDDMWDAFRVTNPDGSYTVEGQETILVTVSFSGPNHSAFARAWRDGLRIGQNRDDLTAQKIAFHSFAETAVLPALLKEQWVKRSEVRGTFHRWAVRHYPVLTIQAADADIFNEKFHTLVTVTPPTP